MWGMDGVQRTWVWNAVPWGRMKYILNFLTLPDPKFDIFIGLPYSKFGVLYVWGIWMNDFWVTFEFPPNNPTV